MFSQCFCSGSNVHNRFISRGGSKIANISPDGVPVEPIQSLLQYLKINAFENVQNQFLQAAEVLPKTGTSLSPAPVRPTYEPPPTLEGAAGSSWVIKLVVAEQVSSGKNK
nr:unnamed protein product [Callosobruchus chinensis]